MKRAETIALWVTAGLLLITAILCIAVAKYGAVCLWAGALAAAAQTILAALVWWGLRLARQQVALIDEAQAAARFTPLAPLGTFHMSYADDTAPVAPAPAPVEPDEITSLDTGFQRVIIALCALGLSVLAAVIGWLVYRDFTSIAPGQTIVVSPTPIDPGAVVAAGGAMLLYLLMIPLTRVTAETEGYGEAANGLVLLGFPGSVVLFGAVLAAWMGVAYASQSAAIVIGVVLALQALELGLNALRNYGTIEELEQAGVDLQQLPLVPLLTSGWIVGIRVLLAESVGMSRSTMSWSGVLARLLPRVIVAGLLILLGISTLHVVPTGDVGIREHFGVTTARDLEHPLAAGLHVMWPWPIDRLSYVPTERIHSTVVSTEMKHQANLGPNAFSFWSEHQTNPDHEFLTGDITGQGTSSSQLLDGIMDIWWRVSNAGDFFHNVSSRAVVVYGGSAGTGTQARLSPMDKALVHQVALYAVTRVFARHALGQIMETQTGDVAAQCRRFIQRQLNAMQAGIQILGFDIKDIHPPVGEGVRYTAQGRMYGPARAFENVVSAREQKQRLIASAQQTAFSDEQLADGYATAAILMAQAHAVWVTNLQRGQAQSLRERSDAFVKGRQAAMAWEFYRALGHVFDAVNKVVLGPGVKPPEIWQFSRRRRGPVPPPLRGGASGGVGGSAPQ